ncbi:MAG: hypothetical protein ABL970_05650 [Nitrospira sp.]
MAVGGSGNGLYEHLYKRFFENRDRSKGYDFQHAPGGSVAPPSVTFSQRLRWWTWDRWQRRKQILAERDRLQRNIVNMRRSSLPGSKP